jgi:energy-coupling factor transporter transmembrane protein EcfT
LEESNKIEKEPVDPANNIIKEEINLQLNWYLPAFFIVYFGSFLIPAIVFMMFIMLFYLPFFLEVRNFISLFANLPSLIASLTLPIVIIICYLIHLFVVALITRWFWGISEKRSPSKSGIIPRNIPSKTLNYYHFRSFIIKYPKNAFSRGPFPWLVKWMFNFTKTNTIGKGSVIEEQIAGDRFVSIGENSYLGTNVAISSHAVDGVFGNISFAKIKIGDNATAAAFNCFAPGVETGNNSWWLPMTGATKYNILKGNNFYLGTPLRKIFKRKVMDYLQVTEEDLKRAEELNKTLDLSKKNKIEKKVPLNE